VRRIAENTKLPYFSLTPTFSVCPDHGYFKGEQFKCPEPKCGKECEVFSRIVGYYRPVQNWNVGKQEEFKDRKTFLESKAVQNKFAKEAPKEAPKEEPKACSCAA
ncbi:MAG: anaerobic ribonucleoside-triphosphate reductase, partial [Candidatus Aenigmatarchaeota archaeon]